MLKRTVYMTKREAWASQISLTGAIAFLILMLCVLSALGRSLFAFGSPVGLWHAVVREWSYYGGELIPMAGPATVTILVGAFGVVQMLKTSELHTPGESPEQTRRRFVTVTRIVISVATALLVVTTPDRVMATSSIVPILATLFGAGVGGFCAVEATRHTSHDAVEVAEQRRDVASATAAHYLALARPKVNKRISAMSYLVKSLILVGLTSVVLLAALLLWGQSILPDPRLAVGSAFLAWCAIMTLAASSLMLYLAAASSRHERVAALFAAWTAHVVLSSFTVLLAVMLAVTTFVRVHWELWTVLGVVSVTTLLLGVLVHRAGAKRRDVQGARWPWLPHEAILCVRSAMAVKARKRAVDALRVERERAAEESAEAARLAATVPNK